MTAATDLANDTTPDAKPPRARKPRPAKGKPAPTPKAPRAPRKPHNTIHAWIRSQGAHYVEAARILGAGFVRDLREEREKIINREVVAARVETLRGVLRNAEAALAMFPKDAPTPHMNTLDSLAKSIATARGDVPHPDDEPKPAQEFDV